MTLQLTFRSYSFALTRPLKTASGCLRQRHGWLLRLSCMDSGRVGWGEVATLTPADRQACERTLGIWSNSIDARCSRDRLEGLVPTLPAAMAFAIGAALAELDGVAGPWRSAPRSAELLPAGDAMIPALDRLLAMHSAPDAITVKWKVAAAEPEREWSLLAQLLETLPAASRLRLDANGGWDRAEADRWASVLAADPRLDWLEQPLAVDDLEGLEQLAQRLPVALDESLLAHPSLREQWRGWQVRRPLREGDPRRLLRHLQQGRPRLALSTDFETGIGFRWLALLARVQQQGPTPVAPGLAPGWCPESGLFSSDPEEVWSAAALGA